MGRHNGHNQSNRNACGWDKPPWPQPEPEAVAPTAFLPDLAEDIAREKGRKRGLAGFSQQIPQFLIVFAFHRLEQLNVSTPRKLRHRPDSARRIL